MKNILKKIFTFIAGLILSALFLAVGKAGYSIMEPYNGHEVTILNFFIVAGGFVLVFIGSTGSFLFFLWSFFGLGGDAGGVGACDGLGG